MMRELKVARIGAAAAEIIAQGGAGKVIGVTSKGVFLRIGNQIMFLTSADYLSPFNLTIMNEEKWLKQLQPEDSFSIRQGELYFPETRITFRVDGAETWIPSDPAVIETSFEEQIILLNKWNEILLRKDPEKGYLFLVNSNTHGAEKDVIRRTSNAVSSLVEGFRSQDKEMFINAASILLGSGGGLTPSGDDLISGFFLYHNRYDRAAGIERKFVSEWCSEVTSLAFQRTTTISANRLIAAGRGWSEKLFLQLIDALFDPSIYLSGQYFDQLINFGHSSGVDTAMGIYFAVKSLV